MIAFLAIFAFNYVFTQTLWTHPEISRDQVTVDDLVELGERVFRVLVIGVLVAGVVLAAALSCGSGSRWPDSGRRASSRTRRARSCSPF